MRVAMTLSHAARRVREKDQGASRREEMKRKHNRRNKESHFSQHMRKMTFLGSLATAEEDVSLRTDKVLNLYGDNFIHSQHCACLRLA